MSAVVTDLPFISRHRTCAGGSSVYRTAQCDRPLFGRPRAVADWPDARWEAARPWDKSNVGVLGDLERIIDLDSKVANRTLELCVTEQELHSTKVLGLSIDQGRLCAAQRVGAVFMMIEADQ
jgi:hypothetical protein